MWPAFGIYYQLLSDKRGDQIRRYPTQERIESLIRYINDVKLNVKEASTKAKITHKTGYYYYKKYLKDPNHSFPMRLHQLYTQDQKNELISCIVNDKMSVQAASRKANINFNTGYWYYKNYIVKNNVDVPIPKRITQDKINRLIGYIVDDKMTIKAASKKANMSAPTGRKYYHQYLINKKQDIPTRSRRVVSAPKNE